MFSQNNAEINKNNFFNYVFLGSMRFSININRVRVYIAEILHLVKGGISMVS